jgi:hypothetical protein
MQEIGRGNIELRNHGLKEADNGLKAVILGSVDFRGVREHGPVSATVRKASFLKGEGECAGIVERKSDGGAGVVGAATLKQPAHYRVSDPIPWHADGILGVGDIGDSIPTDHWRWFSRSASRPSRVHDLR